MRRRELSSGGGLQSVDLSDGGEGGGALSEQLCVDRGESHGLRPVALKKGESIIDAFRRVQRECTGSGRPFVICLE